jgi:hypothetical protein
MEGLVAVLAGHTASVPLGAGFDEFLVKPALEVVTALASQARAGNTFSGVSTAGS